MKTEQMKLLGPHATELFQTDEAGKLVISFDDAPRFDLLMHFFDVLGEKTTLQKCFMAPLALVFLDVDRMIGSWLEH